MVLPKSEKLNSYLTEIKNYGANLKYVEATKLYEQNDFSPIYIK